MRTAPGSVSRTATDKRAAMAKRRNADFDLSRLQQLLKAALYPFDRHRLTGRRAARGHDHGVAVHTQNGVWPARDSRDRLPDERFEEGTGSRLNRHSSDYPAMGIDRQRLAKLGPPPSGVVERHAVIASISRQGEGRRPESCVLACGHVPEQLRGRGRGERGGLQQGEGSGVAGNVRRAVQAEAAARAGQVDHAQALRVGEAQDR